jgi:hypothetical protein
MKIVGKVVSIKSGDTRIEVDVDAGGRPENVRLPNLMSACDVEALAVVLTEMREDAGIRFCKQHGYYTREQEKDSGWRCPGCKAAVPTEATE